MRFWPCFHNRVKLYCLEKHFCHLAPAALVVPASSSLPVLAQVFVEPCGDFGLGKELGLEQTVYIAELTRVGSQCRSPHSCRDGCASTRRGQRGSWGHCCFSCLASLSSGCDVFAARIVSGNFCVLTPALPFVFWNKRTWKIGVCCP